MDAWGVGVLPSGYLLNIVNYGIDGWKVMKMAHWWMSKVMIYLEMVIFPFLCKKQPEGTSDRTTIWIRQQGISSGELDACRSDPWLCTWQQDGPRIRTTQSLACRDNLDSGDSLGQPGCIPHNISQECRKKWECWPAIGQKSINRQICWPGSQVRYLQTHVHDMPKPHFPGTRAGHASSTGRNASARTGWNKPARRRQSGWIVIY